MPLPISSKTPSDTSPAMNRTNRASDIGSDAWMLEQGFRPLTPAESQFNASHRVHECADRAGAPRPGKIIDLVSALRKYINRAMGRP
jgi:hypothetical protein